MKGFKATSTNPYTYTQSGVWKKGQYTFQAVVLSDSGYAFAFQRADTTWQTVDLSWQVKGGSYSKIQWTFTLEVDAVAFRLIANTVTGETIVVQPMLEKGTNGSTPIAHEEDLRGMDGDFHEFIFTRNDTGIAPPTPLSTQENDHVPIDDSVEPPVIWTDNPQGVTKELPFEFVSMREKKNGVWLNFSPPSLWAKWAEDGFNLSLQVQGHFVSHWEGIEKVTEIVGGEYIDDEEVVKVTAVIRKGEKDVTVNELQSRGFRWYVNGFYNPAWDNQSYITLDETYGDGFADFVILSYLVNSLREEVQVEVMNLSEGMDGIGEESIFIAHDSEVIAPELPQPTDAGYQEDDYHGHWSDDPVSPTKVDQFVWTAKRKKVGGIWEAFGVPSVWTRWVEDGEDAIPPIIIDGYWAFWNATLQDYEKSSFSAVGDDGHSPYVDDVTGTWWQWSSVRGEYEDTGIKAEGKDGSDGEDGEDGEDGDGITSTTIHYAKSSNGITPPSSGWGTSLPTPTQGWYLWTRTTTTYKVAETTVSYSVSHWAEDGDDAKDIRLTATNTQAVIGTNGVTPTQIKVTGSAKNTTISGWSYSVDGGSFTTPPNGVTRSGSVVTINTAVATWRTLAIKAYNTTDNVDSVITISIVGYGAAGEKGKVPIVKEWLTSDTHLNNDDVVDFIYYRPTRTWWKLKDEYTSRTATSSPSTTYYEQIPYMSALATKVLIAEEANLANFIFKDGQLISVRGTVNGAHVDYAGQAGFLPAIVIDGKAGDITVQTNTIGGSVWTGHLSPNGLIFEVSYINGTYSPKKIWIAGSGAISITDESDPSGYTATHIGSDSITVQGGGNGIAIQPDGVYVNGVKLTGGGGGSDYTHPSTHSADMITAGTFQGIVKANNNTSYTTKQVRNMILSTGNAVSSQMANGDIWIKYE